LRTVCIGIPIQSEPQRLRVTLDSLRSMAGDGVATVVLPDAPDDQVIDFLSRIDAPVVTGGEAIGAAACFNRLAVYSDADVLILLESGARVGPQWLKHLLAGLGADSRNGLAGPSTNISWNEQCVFPRIGGSDADVEEIAREVEAHFRDHVRTLEPLFSLGDFCYAVRREVIEAIGAADEHYSTGPCWEMDYNIRAARAGWRGLWVGAAYVHRAPFTARRRLEEARRFENSKHLYQDKFCGARLRGEKTDYREHCRGDACPNFAPADLIEIKRPLVKAAAVSVRYSPAPAPAPASAKELSAIPAAVETPLVTCIMPTYNRRAFVPQAIRCFLRQDYENAELLIVDDGTDCVADCVPETDRIRYIRLERRLTIGAKRNFACEQARGEFIVHWDDDDWYPNDRVSRQVAALRERDISGSSRIYYYDVANSKAWEYRFANSNAAWVGGNTLAYRKSYWARHRFPDVQVGEDSRFVWSSGGRSIADLADPGLCVATAHTENTSRKDLNGSYWHSQPRDLITSLLGDEIYFYVRPSSDWPLVTCIMPTYNRRAYVPQAIQSFLQQDYPNRELIIVDDGKDRMEDLIPPAENIHYLRPSRRMSIGAKRNLACQHARGEIIAHWDDDDWYSPDRLRYQVAPIVNGAGELTGLENKFVLQLPSGEFWTNDPQLHERMFVQNVHGGTLVYRKDVWSEGFRYPEINLAEDAWLIYRATQSGKRLLRLANPGVFVYVRHGTNAWREFAPGSFIDPKGWQRIARPLIFPPQSFSFFMTASAGGA
jgi:glycosyltransferase involved in cell wall biosynthesis